MLWAGVEAGEPLAALYRANERAARAAGLEPDPRNFKPHVTLARMRGVRHQAVARFLQEHGGLRTQPFTVTRFVLLSARPGSGGRPMRSRRTIRSTARSDWADDATLEQDRF